MSCAIFVIQRQGSKIQEGQESELYLARIVGDCSTFHCPPAVFVVVVIVVVFKVEIS